MGVVVCKSKSIIRDYLFDNDKIYNVEDVVNNFSSYFGISFEEMVKLYSNYSIIDEVDVWNYVFYNFDKMYECSIGFYGKEIITSKRLRDYFYYKELLAVLGHKGINYLNVLKYVADSNNIFAEDDFYEKALENLEVFHFSKGMTGKHLNKIMIALYHIMNEFKSNLKEINRLDGYDRQRVNELSFIFDENDVAACDCLVLTDDRYLDKTSLRKTYQR